MAKKGLLAGIFKKKEGGSLFGNVFRGVTSTLADKIGLKDVVEAINPVPGAPKQVQDLAKLGLAQAAAAEAQTPAAAWDFAKSVGKSLTAAGASQQEVKEVEAAVSSVAQKPAIENGGQIVGQSLTGKEVVKILTGAVDGAKNGAVDTYLDETEDGRKVKKDAVNSQGEKMLPYIVIGLLAFIFWTQAKK